MIRVQQLGRLLISVRVPGLTCRATLSNLTAFQPVLSGRKLKIRFFASEITVGSSGRLVFLGIFGIEAIVVVVDFSGVKIASFVFGVRVIGLVVHGVIAVAAVERGPALGGGTGDLVVKALEVGLVILILRSSKSCEEGLRNSNYACMAVMMFSILSAHLHVFFLVARVRGVQLGVQLLVPLLLHALHLDLNKRNQKYAMASCIHYIFKIKEYFNIPAMYPVYK